MNHNQLEQAYTMLSEFKSGQLESGSDISDEQIDLIRLLSQDLLPHKDFKPELATDALLDVAREDMRWNQLTQKTITDCYSLRESKQTEAAKKLQKDFYEKCPSSWYRQIVESI